MFNNTFAREDDDVRKGGKKSIGEEIDILSACSAHLSRARLATWPLTHVIAWAAVLFFFSPRQFFSSLSPHICLFTMLYLSVVKLDEGGSIVKWRREMHRMALHV